jgi:hypothetical protein
MTEPHGQTTPGPYATAAPTYWAAGWRGILPLPPNAKTPVPRGYTGAAGAWPSYPDITAWTEDQGHGNIALRLPPDVLGVDVDHYGNKPGGAVLADLEQRLGALPATWRTTSRDDGVSGIRLYRIPAGLRWPGVLGPGIETIRHEHRYAVAWPSIHPGGGTYRWITPDGATTLGVVPGIDDLPDLPAAWIEHFTHGELATDQARADMSGSAAHQWIIGRDAGALPPCRHMDRALQRGLADMTGATSRHDTMLSLTNRLVWLAGEGHVGSPDALVKAQQVFLSAVAGDRDPAEAAAEFDRMVTGAVRIAAAAHPMPSPDPCDDPFAGLIAPKDQPWTQPSTTKTAAPSPTTSTASPPPSNASPTTSTPPPSSSETSPNSASSDEPPAQGEASREVATRLRPGGAFILDIPDNVPAIWGRGEAVLWAEGEALTICGPAGVGKTTLTGQVLRARLVGGEVLGYPVQPTTTKVLYLAMDRPRQIARALRRTLGDLPRQILDERLIIWPGPPIADVAAHPETLVGLVKLAGADTVIVDSIKDAAVGLSSDEVGAGYNRARQMCIAEGIEVLEQHHMVKKGDNGSRPTSLADLYGSVWIGAGAGSVLLMHGAAGDPIVEMTHLKTPAEEVGPSKLIHDHQAGRTEIWHQTDLLAMARACGHRGITAKAAASTIAEKENPTKAEIEKARRRLDRLVTTGQLHRVEGNKGGSDGGQAASWVFVAESPTAGLIPTDHETDHGRDRSETSTNRSHGVTANPVSAGQSDHGTDHGGHGGTDHDSHPPFKGVGSVGEAPNNDWMHRVVGGEQVEVHRTTGEVRTPEASA